MIPGMPFISAFSDINDVAFSISAFDLPSQMTLITELDHFFLTVYGLQYLCLRLTDCVTTFSSRLDT